MQFTYIDTTQSLYDPRRYQLIFVVDQHLSSGLWKIGQCYEDKLGTFPRDAAQYDTRYRDDVVLLAHGMVDKLIAEQLETDAIQRAKFHLRTGVNTKDQDAVSHYHYSSARPGAVYAVPVRSDVATTQEEFKQVHVPYYCK